MQKRFKILRSIQATFVICSSHLLVRDCISFQIEQRT